MIYGIIFFKKMHESLLQSHKPHSNNDAFSTEWPDQQDCINFRPRCYFPIGNVLVMFLYEMTFCKEPDTIHFVEEVSQGMFFATLKRTNRLRC